MSSRRIASRFPSRSVAALVPLLSILCAAQVGLGGTVAIGDQTRGVQWTFGGSEPFGSSNSQSSPTPQPFSTTVNEIGAGSGSGDLARVRATYDSLLSSTVSSASGELLVDRVGRPAAANASFIFEFGVNDGPVDLALALDVTYQRTSGSADPFAATGQLHVAQIPLGAPPGTPAALVLNHEFALGGADDTTETFRRADGGDDGDALQLDPGAYAFVFNIGLPEGPPDFTNWDVDDTSTDRSDRVSFDVAARFTSVGGGDGNGGNGPPVIPLPSAALSGGTLLAALAAYRRVRVRRS